MKHRIIQLKIPGGGFLYVRKRNETMLSTYDDFLLESPHYYTASVWHDMELFEEDFKKAIEWFNSYKKTKYMKHLKNCKIVAVKVAYDRGFNPKDKITYSEKIQ